LCRGELGGSKMLPPVRGNLPRGRTEFAFRFDWEAKRGPGVPPTEEAKFMTGKALPEHGPNKVGRLSPESSIYK
jgi:hypothetical protein